MKYKILKRSNGYLMVYSIYKAYTLMIVLFKVTSQMITKYGLELKYKLKKSQIDLWWVLWVDGGLIGAYSFLVSTVASSFDEYRFITLLDLIREVIIIIDGLIIIKIIQNSNEVSPAVEEIYEMKFGDNTPKA